MFCKFSKRFPAFFICSQILFSIENSLFSDSPPSRIFVTNINGGSYSDGSLGAAISVAGDGAIIDCSQIAGQTIGLDNPFPAIGQNFTSSTSSLTILGRGVIIDGSNGSHSPSFSLAQGSVTITGFTFQNGLSRGGSGGVGHTGGGGGTGGGGALYIHPGATMTISAIGLNNNQASGGDGGDGTTTGGSGGGGGGYGGGAGGFSASANRALVGSGGGGGGNGGGTSGGRNGGNGLPNSFSNLGGAGGGGEALLNPGHPLSGAKSGGNVPANPASSAWQGGLPGTSTTSNGGGAGGGAGSAVLPNVGRGFNGFDSIPAESGIGGAGGIGFGSDNTYGAGGGGGGGNGGGAGYGTSGGGGGLTGPGGDGGSLGGGGGASGSSSGGNGGFGAGGGAGFVGGNDIYGIGGSGGAATSGPAGGGGGSGLGGAIFIHQGGLLIIEDGISFSGNSTSPGMGGTATGANGENGSSLGQDIFIRSGGSITFQINGTLTLSNPIEGAGLLSDVDGPGALKSGFGTVNLNGVNTYMGDTLVQSGILNLNGSIRGDLHIEPSGTLSGNAIVNGILYNSGTISPGNSIGEVFTTDLYLYPTSVYNVEIDSAGGSDEIIASGFAYVEGGVVVTPDDFNFTDPLTYTIISASGGVTGSFSSLTSQAPALMSLVYDPLTVQLTYLPLEAIGLTGDASSVANCFVTIPVTPGSDAATINNALLGLSFDGVQTAFEQMGPAEFSGLTEVQLLDAILVRSTYTKHLQSLCLKKDQSCGQPISLWIDGIGGWQNQKKSSSQLGYKDTTLGATLGVDYCIRSLVLGLAFSSTYDNFHVKNSDSKANINSYYGGFYGRWNYDEFYMNASVLGAQNNYRTKRQIGFGSVDRQAHAKHKGNEWLTNFGFGYQVSPSHFRWTPYVNLDYVGQHEHSYTESGAKSLDLHVKAKNAMLFQGEVGVLFSTTYSVWNGVFMPKLTLAYINQTPFSNKHYHANFEDSSCSFRGKGGDYERNLFAPRLALTYQGFRDKVNVSIYYDAEVGNRYWAQDVGFDLGFRF